jgi:hypothetical protein
VSKNDHATLNRRDLLALLAKTGFSAPLLMGSAGLAQAPRAPANVTIVGGSALGAGRAVITPDDLKFAGFIRIPASAGSLWFSDGRLAFRNLNGETRLFLFGDRTKDNPLLEMRVSETPNPDLAKAPTCTLVRDWGTVMAARMITGGSAGAYPGGLYWDAARNAVWWSYGDIYVPNQSHPTLGCTILDDGRGAWTSYGPWRTEWTSQRTRGAFCDLPPAFSSAFTSGKGVGLMASQASGNVSSPFGAILSAVSLPDPVSTPADVASNTHWTVANHGIILHDMQHRMARDTRYKNCGWQVKYDCQAGSTIDSGIPLFGGPDPAAGQSDTMSNCVWIDLPDKHGLLYFGQLVTTPEGYTAPGDPDGFVHQWYGAPIRKDGSAPRTCCHGQDDPFWQATGPGAHYRVPMGWIYNPDDLVATAQKKANLWSRTPTSTFQWRKYVPTLKARYAGGMWAGSVFDRANRRVYALMGRQDDVTVPPHERPVILVFDIK